MGYVTTTIEKTNEDVCTYVADMARESESILTPKPTNCGTHAHLTSRLHPSSTHISSQRSYTYEHSAEVVREVGREELGGHDAHDD